MRTELESRAESGRPVSEYRRVILAFQQVYTLDPAYPRSPAALAAAAALYEEMGRQFHDSRYYRAAVKSYEFVIKQYPRSAVARDALFIVAEIYRSDLNQQLRARDAYRSFLERYPAAAKAPEARQKLLYVQHALARPVTAAKKGTSTETSPDTEAASSDAGSEREADTSENGGPRLVRVTGVRSWVGSNYTRIVIGMEDEVKFAARRLKNPDRLVFDLSNSRPSPALAGKSFPVEGGFLRQVRIAQFQPTVTRAVLDVERIDSYSLFSLPNPFRIIIDIHGAPLLASARSESTSNRTASGLHSSRGLAPTVSITSSPASLSGTRDPRSQTPNRTAVEQLSPSTNANADKEDTSSVAAESESADEDSGDGPAVSATSRESSRSADGRVRHGSVPSSPSPSPSSLSSKDSADDPEFTYRPKASKESQLSDGLRMANAARPGGPAAPGTLTRALGLKIGRIVIDPGHGGHDTGTIGPHGLCEKDLVLDVASRLKHLIEDRMGADVVMTRTDDTFIPLEERTAIANQKGADLFVSIHANASRNQGARGIETYYLNFTSNAEALEVAARENATSAESVHQLQSLIKKIALTEKIRESEDFALQVQRELYARVESAGGGQEDRGVKRAPFVVLIGANMPSILAEISFLTNPRDEKLLRKPEYRQRIAVALYQGIRGYTANLGGLKVAQRARSPIGKRNAVVLDASEARNGIAQ